MKRIVIAVLFLTTVLFSPPRTISSEAEVYANIVQDLQDVVYLKDGSIIRGIILEQVPGEVLKIQTADGSIFVYKMSLIQKITRETPPTKQNRKSNAVVEEEDTYEPWPLKQFGVHINPLGFLQLGPSLIFEIRASNNITIGPYLRYSGVGLLTEVIYNYDNISEENTWSGGANAKYFFGNSNDQHRWFVGTSLEYGIASGKDYDEYEYYSSYYDDYEYADVHYNSEYFGVLMQGGYRWRFLSQIDLSLHATLGLAVETQNQAYVYAYTQYAYAKYINVSTGSGDVYALGMIEFLVGFEF